MPTVQWTVATIDTITITNTATNHDDRNNNNNDIDNIDDDDDENNATLTTTKKTFLATVSRSPTNDILLHDVSDGNLLGTLRGHKEVICAIVILEDQSAIITGGWDGFIIIWERYQPYRPPKRTSMIATTTNRPRRRTYRKCTSLPTLSSHDDAAGWIPTVALDVGRDERARRLLIRDLAVLPDDTIIAICDNSIINVMFQKRQRTANEGGDYEWRRIATCLSDDPPPPQSKIKNKGGKPKKKEQALLDKKWRLWTCHAVSSPHFDLYCGCSDGSVQIWERSTLVPPTWGTPHPSSSPHHAPQILTPSTILAGHTAPISCIAILPSHAAFATGSHDNTIRTWGYDEGSGSWACYAVHVDGPSIPPAGHVNCTIAFSVPGVKGVFDVVVVEDEEEGVWLASATGEDIRLWEGISSSGEREMNLIVGWPDGEDDDGERCGYLGSPIEMNVALRLRKGHTRDITCLAIIPPSHADESVRLASGSYDNTIRIWRKINENRKQETNDNDDDESETEYSPPLPLGRQRKDPKWKMMEQLTGHPNTVWKIEVLPNGMLSASGGGGWGPSFQWIWEKKRGARRWIVKSQRLWSRKSS